MIDATSLPGISAHRPVRTAYRARCSIVRKLN